MDQYTLIPPAASGIFYHYTTTSGLEGILRSGGLRATYRMEMNDHSEFEYARKLIFKELKKLGKRNDFPPPAQDMATYAFKNLDKFLNNTTKVSSAYCACLTVSSDDKRQWEAYAESGSGFAIGFDLLQLLKVQKLDAQWHGPYIYCDPVIYDQRRQCELVWDLVEAGYRDLQTFAENISKQSDHLTALRDRITREIVICLFVAIDFIKAPRYSSEREMRLMLDSNDGTLNASKIQHYERNNQSIPYIFMDLRNPNTGCIPLAEVRIGPKGNFSEKKVFLNSLLGPVHIN